MPSPVGGAVVRLPELSDQGGIACGTLVADGCVAVPRYETTPPLVVAEVLSPSTRAFDLSVKRERYAAGGVEAYFVVDPEVPSVTVWAWRAGAFVVVAASEGDAELVVDAPLSLRLRPSDLIR